MEPKHDGLESFVLKDNTDGKTSMMSIITKKCGGEVRSLLVYCSLTTLDCH